jgi:hypothetical protein
VVCWSGRRPGKPNWHLLTGPDSPPQPLGDDEMELLPLVRLGKIGTSTFDVRRYAAFDILLFDVRSFDVRSFNVRSLL